MKNLLILFSGLILANTASAQSLPPPTYIYGVMLTLEYQCQGDLPTFVNGRPAEKDATQQIKGAETIRYYYKTKETYGQAEVALGTSTDSAIVTPLYEDRVQVDLIGNVRLVGEDRGAFKGNEMLIQNVTTHINERGESVTQLILHKKSKFSVLLGSSEDQVGTMTCEFDSNTQYLQ